jgi:hypothetical protein
MAETLQFHCLICKHRWIADIEPDAEDVVHITVEDICPKCEAQGEVIDEELDTAGTQ